VRSEITFNKKLINNFLCTRSIAEVKDGLPVIKEEGTSELPTFLG
jgi:hypothetical protein